MGPTSTAEELKIFQLKSKAVAYYQENGVPQKIEDVLNDMFYDSPEDVFGYLCNYFERLSNPAKVTRVQAIETLDCRGVAALGVDIFCTYKNHEKLYTTLTFPNSLRTYDHSSAEEKDEEETERKTFLQAALLMINGDLGGQLSTDKLDPTQQAYLDTLLTDELLRLEREDTERKAAEEEAAIDEEPVEAAPKKETSSKNKPSAKGKKGGGGKEVVVIPDEPREPLLPGCNAIGALSLAVCLAGAKARQLEFSDHVAALANHDVGSPPEKLRLPLPMVTIISGGKSSTGKQNCVKEYMVVPNPEIPTEKVIRDIPAIYKCIAKSVFVKSGPSSLLVNDLGALMPLLDRPDQGLDLLVNALNQLELQEDYKFVLNLAGHEIFDHEKGKYEVISGQLKGADDLVEFYAELIGRYPQVIGIIDPMRKQEAEAWMRLGERISERCLIIGDRVYHRPGLLINETFGPEFQTSGWSVQLEQRNLITEVIDCAEKMRDADNKIVVTANQADTHDTWIVDFAFGVQADFIRLGAPCRGERVAKLLRWQRLADDLTQCDRLQLPPSEMAFPTVAPPAPPEPEEGDESVLPPVDEAREKLSAKKK